MSQGKYDGPERRRSLAQRVEEANETRRAAMTPHARKTEDLIDGFQQSMKDDDIHGFFAKVAVRLIEGEVSQSQNADTRRYGGTGTIHSTDYVDVETLGGEVVAVWFRCQTLAFKQSEVDPQRAFSMRENYSNPDYVSRIEALELKR